MSDGEAVIREVWRRWNGGERAYNPEFIDPEAEVHSALTGQVFRGEQGVNRWIAEIDEQFEEWDLSIEDVDEVSPGRLLIRGAVRARGRQSGVDLDQPITWITEVRDGRMTLLKNFMGPDGELRARAEL